MSVAEIAYRYIVDSGDSMPVFVSLEELDGDVALAWTLSSSSAQDSIDATFPLEEATLERMTGVQRPWADLHHWSYFSTRLVRS